MINSLSSLLSFVLVNWNWLIRVLICICGITSEFSNRRYWLVIWLWYSCALLLYTSKIIIFKLWTTVFSFKIYVFTRNRYLEILLCLLKLCIAKWLFLSVSKCNCLLLDIWCLLCIIIISIVYLILFTTVFCNGVLNFLTSIFWI